MLGVMTMAQFKDLKTEARIQMASQAARTTLRSTTHSRVIGRLQRWAS
jgi:hypothetical protein